MGISYEEVSPGIYEPWQPDEEESSIMTYWDASEADEWTSDMCNVSGDPTKDLTYVIPREKRLPGWRGNLKEELSFQMSYPGLINVGQPHSVSIDHENLWLYLERSLSKGKYHKLGQHVLKKNNTLVLKFDKFGILKDKEIYDKNNTNQIAFSNKETTNELSKRSFVETFLSSLKQKMYGNRK